MSTFQGVSIRNLLELTTNISWLWLHLCIEVAIVGLTLLFELGRGFAAGIILPKMDGGREWNYLRKGMLAIAQSGVYMKEDNIALESTKADVKFIISAVVSERLVWDWHHIFTWWYYLSKVSSRGKGWKFQAVISFKWITVQRQ